MAVVYPSAQARLAQSSLGALVWPTRGAISAGEGVECVEFHSKEVEGHYPPSPPCVPLQHTMNEMHQRVSKMNIQVRGCVGGTTGVFI